MIVWRYRHSYVMSHTARHRGNEHGAKAEYEQHCCDKLRYAEITRVPEI